MKRRWISIPLLLTLFLLIGGGLKREPYAHASIGDILHGQISPLHRTAQTVIVSFGGVLGFSYSPQDSFILPGDTVRWLGDFTAHHLVSDDGLWQEVGNGSEFSFTFEQPGKYDYHCFPHGSLGMNGSVTVGETFFLPLLLK